MLTSSSNNSSKNSSFTTDVLIVIHLSVGCLKRLPSFSVRL